jgi:hypothetical protein
MKTRLNSLDDLNTEADRQIEELESNHRALCDHYEKSMKEVAEAIRKLNVRARQGGVIGGNNVTGGDVARLRVEHDRLKSVVANMKQQATSSGNASTQGQVTMQAPWRIEFDNLKRKLGDLEGNSGQMFVHNRIIFHTKQDVKVWLLVAMTVDSPGIFWDLFSAMVCMKPKNQSERERADESYSASRTNTKTLKNELMASVSDLRPALMFGKANGVLARMEEGVGACSLHAEWLGSGLDSYLVLMTNHLTEFMDSVTVTLDLNTTQGPVHDFARELLDKIEKGWSALLRFTKRFYTKLTMVAKFSAKTAWQHDVGQQYLIKWGGLEQA